MPKIPIHTCHLPRDKWPDMRIWPDSHREEYISLHQAARDWSKSNQGRKDRIRDCNDDGRQE